MLTASDKRSCSSLVCSHTPLQYVHMRRQEYWDEVIDAGLGVRWENQHVWV